MINRAMSSVLTGERAVPTRIAVALSITILLGMAALPTPTGAQSTQGSTSGANGLGSSTTISTTGSVPRPPASSTDGPPTSPRGPTPGAPASPIELRDQTAFVAPTGTLMLKLAIPDPPADAILSFDVMRAFNNNDARAQLDATASGKGRERLMGLGGGYPAGLAVSELPMTNGEVTVELNLATSAAPVPERGFQIDDAGVYPLVVTLSGGEPRKEIGKFTTYLIRLPTVRNELPPFQVAGILPFRAPLAIGNDGRSEVSAETVVRLNDLATVTRSNPSVPVALAPNPSTIYALGRMPSQNSKGVTPAELATAWKGQELLTSTFVPVDIDAWVASNLQDELSRQFRLGTDTITNLLHPTPQANRRTWLLEPTLTPESLTELNSMARDQLVMPPDAVEPLDPKFYKPEQAQVVATEPFEVEVGNGGRYRAITTDSRLRDRFTASQNPALNAQLAIADLAVLWFGADRPLNVNTPAPLNKPRGVAVVFPEDVQGLASVDRFLGALAQPVAKGGPGGGRPIVEPVTLEKLFTMEPATTPKTETPLVRSYRPRPEAGPKSMGDYRTRLSAARVSVSGYRTMVQDTEPDRVQPLDLLVDVSGAAQLTPPQRQSYLDAATATVSAAAGAIQPLAQENITLGGSDAELPIRLENRNEYPVAVRVALASDKLTFPNNNFVTTLQPGITKLGVKVMTVTSGEIRLTVRLESPDGNIALAANRFSVVSTLFSNVGLALTIGAGLFLALWWGRNFRKTRRALKLVPVGPSAVDPA